MVKLFFSSVLVFLLFMPSDKASVAMLFMEDSIDFTTNKHELKKQKVQMFVGLLDKKLERVNNELPAGFDFFNDALPLDVFDYWQNKGDESYYVLVTKVVYVIEQDVSIFNESLLSDEQMLKKKMPDYRLKKIGDNQFHMECGFMAPSFDYNLKFHRPPFKDKQASVQKELQRLNPELGVPELMVVQHNYNYGRVMLHKTSKMSVCIANYYPFDDGKTLEVNYTLNYIHDLPPNLLGGHKLLIREIKEGIADLIFNTRIILDSNSGYLVSQ